MGTKKELRAQARTAAVAARERATLYTEAAGVRLGPVVQIQDVDSDQLQNTYRCHGQTMSAGGGAPRCTICCGSVTGCSTFTILSA